jgi:hypothetical protein
VCSSDLLIDAGYLSKIAKHLGDGSYLKYKIQTFAVNITKKAGFWCEDIVYYTAPPFQSNNPSQDEILRKQGYDKTIEKMKKGGFPRVRIREGRIQKIDNNYTQKGVDTLLAFDLLRYAQLKEHETIILVTADTDFVPIIKELKQMYPTKLFLAFYTDLKRKSGFSLSNELWKIFEREYKITIKKDDFFMQES